MSVFSPDTLNDLYRYALLVTGSPGAGEALLADALRAQAPRLSQIRNEHGRRASMVLKLRQTQLNAEAQPPVASRRAEAIFSSDLQLLARDFGQLAEPGRTALALLGLSLFTAEEIATLLGCKLFELGDALQEARLQLAALRKAAPIAPTEVAT